MILSLRNNRGFTLIELVMVIIIVGILATVAVRKLSTSVETARYEHTLKEMNALAEAIAGNTNLYSESSRTDFGYVGDVGSLPPNLDALVTNAGGYSTWDGPYINRGIDLNEFKTDGWNVLYTYSDSLIRSTGSGSNIDKLLATSTAALLSNTVDGYIVDADDEMPGAVYSDSLEIHLTYPDGVGSTTTSMINPTIQGGFSFVGIPAGNQTLRVVYLPDNDTTTFSVSVTPQADVKIAITFPADLW
ncbi:MAG: type II secretion system GspH family protein [candidate division Zixibacteria bacterium]|nr:type II secretion system GspH family protein [candidate division Zixibacteria bacterium]MDH3936208.1 type II secretion system GspH family protein [candidate division Zixibacteria bacterium]MDH4033591.1 type II secretion system GspH family protein [candidate division Zixibacteria bacterium]